MSRIQRISLVLVVLVISLSSVAAIQAASVTSAIGFALYCDSFEGDISFTADRDNTGSGAEQVMERVLDGNGTVIYTGGDTVPIGFSDIFSGLAPYDAAPAANPLRYEFVSVAGNGLPEVVEYTVTGSCPGLPDGNVAPPVFTDGRINPQTYAPVVLYCEQSTLGAWNINGVPVMTFTFDADATAPSTNTIVLSANGIDLYALADGRYSVVAPMSDGKLYQFIFGGCPGIGTTEVYVSDPVTGEFMRAE